MAGVSGAWDTIDRYVVISTDTHAGADIEALAASIGTQLDAHPDERRAAEVVEARPLDVLGHALETLRVPPVTGGVGAGVRARRHHAQRRRGTRVGVTYLGFRPPPRGGQTAGLRQGGRRGSDERINIVEDGQNLTSLRPSVVTGR